jgi:hypothetical protein
LGGVHNLNCCRTTYVKTISQSLKDNRSTKHKILKRKDPQEPQDSQDLQDSQDPQDPQDSQDSQDSQDPQEP